jgi:phage shock protein PspC (stress-responsive transcriptional regulator)
VETASRPRNLVRSFDDRIFAGVCGGLASYLGVDPVWVRLAFVLAVLFWGLGLIIYAVLWITLPEEPEEDGAAPVPPMASENPRAVAGVLLLTIGILIILWKILSLLTFKIVVPVVLVGLGAFLLLHRRQ